MGHGNLGWQPSEVFNFSAYANIRVTEMTTEFTVASDRKIQVLNITEKCQNSIGGAKKGVAVFNLMHRTAAIMVGEDEPDLRDDIVRVAEHWLADFHPFRHGRYGPKRRSPHHQRLNRHIAHYIQSLMANCSWAPGRVYFSWSWTDRGAAGSSAQ